MSEPPNRSLLWWVIPGVLAGMPMPFMHPERRLNLGGSLNAYEDELPELYAAGIRAVVSLLNIPSDRRFLNRLASRFCASPCKMAVPRPRNKRANSSVSSTSSAKRDDLLRCIVKPALGGPGPCWRFT